MERHRMILDNNCFIKQNTEFFNFIFGEALADGKGEIEIRAFCKSDSQSHYFGSALAAAKIAHTLCIQKYDVYFGANLRVGRDAKKENVNWLSTFYAILDYGMAGLRDIPDILTDEQARDIIKDYPLLPSALVHSGDGYHCYWVLNDPISIKDHCVDRIENINQRIVWSLGGDHDSRLNEVLRVPGTFNFKVSRIPRMVKLDYFHDKYTIEQITKHIQ